MTQEKNAGKCKVCGKEISEQDSESYDDMCWGCWDDQLTEESDSMFDELMQGEVLFCGLVSIVDMKTTKPQRFAITVVQ